MSDHRQHYFEANGTGRAGRTYVYVLNGIAIAMLAVVAVAAITRYVAGASPQVTPVRMPVITSTEEARIEGFRAGFQAGMEQGCNRPTPLSLPLARR